jgi:hypothetical protein
MRTTVTPVRYPEMRREVVNALTSLSDPAYQRRVWIGRDYPREGFFDDLTLTVNVLYDMVLPDPGARLGTVLTDDREVDTLALLERVLGPLIADLGDAPDARYLSDPRWGDVVDAARSALTAMRRAP